MPTWLSIMSCLFAGFGNVLFASAVVAQRTVPAAGPNPYASMSDEELDALHKAQREGTAPQADFNRSVLPEITQRIDDVRQRMWGADGISPPNRAAASALVDELFVDWGDWQVNALWQETVIGEVSKVVGHPQLSAESREVIRDGLLEFHNGGGGGDSPYQMADLGEALFPSAGYDDITTQELGRQLLVDAKDWALDSGKNRFVNRISETQQSLFGSEGDFTPAVGEDPLMEGVDGLPTAYVEGRRLAHELIQSNHPKSDQLERLYENASILKANPELESDLLERMLVTYERTLKRPNVKTDLVAQIDEKLVELGCDTKRIDTKRLWVLWGRAACALKGRASTDMRRLIDRGLSGHLREDQRVAYKMVALVIFADVPRPGTDTEIGSGNSQEPPTTAPADDKTPTSE